MQISRTPRPSRARIARLAAALVTLAVLGRAATQADPFLWLAPGYGQQLFGTADNFLRGDAGILGGVVVLQNGDVIAAECETSRTRLHLFDASRVDNSGEHDTPLHDESKGDPLPGGCGITYHPDGFIYSNMHDGMFGVAKIDVADGDVKNMRTVARMGPPGNAIGIAVDPANNRLVYPSAGCKPNFVSPQPLNCTIYSLDPATDSRTGSCVAPGCIPLATFLASDVRYVSGIAFEPTDESNPTSEFLFLTNRLGLDSGELIVVNRLGEIEQRVVIDTEPIGIGFHVDPKFVVTNNQNGTMTRFDFDDGYDAPPTFVGDFATGGFRGDQMQAGPDGCLYLTQNGTRYRDGEEDDADSIVQICPGFATPPGITPTPPPPSSLAGFVYVDADNDGVRDSDEQAIAGVTIGLSGTDDFGRLVSQTTTTAANGGYSFTGLFSGTYTINETQPALYLDGKDTQGTPGTGTTQQDRFSNIVLAAGVNGTDNNFGELRPSSLGGYVFLDANANGARDAGETGIAGVTIRLMGTDDLGTSISVQMSTGVDGGYLFAPLRPGMYTIAETQPPGFVDGVDRQGTPGNGTTGNDVFSGISLREGVDGRDNNFGEKLPPVPSSLAGSVYVDANNNGIREAIEQGIAGVVITLTGTNDLGQPVSLSTTTAIDGSYSFGGLSSGTYTIAEVQPAGYADGKDTQGTPGTGTTGQDRFSNIVLAAGTNGMNNNFGELTFEFPAGGFFVVGDRAAQAVGARVNFWGAQWAPNNPTTSGTPPNSFKGFLTGSPPPCGGMWTSRPGNSSDPPESLPEGSLMAIVVSSQVKQKGSVLTGNVARIVIVRVEPGYGPNPGRRGYGQVVAVLCAG